MSPEEEVKAGERAGQFTGPHYPINRPEYAVSNALRTSERKCAGALSCWNPVRVFMLAGTLCIRTLHPYIQLAPYIGNSCCLAYNRVSKIVNNLTVSREGVTIKEKVMAGEYPIPSRVTGSARNLITRLLEPNPDIRPNSQEILEDYLFYGTSNSTSFINIMPH
ncbi:hypothetical protein TNCV_4100261 [Trichonephila clavipes]|nr:hypothetical protein TNCV_4100261 [Trichonephila clavipes]